MKPYVPLLLLVAALAFGPRAGAELFDIVHIGDVHLGTVSARGVDHMTTWVKNNQVSKNIKLMSQTGDIVNTGTDDTAFSTAASSFLAPMLTLAGNMAIGMSTGNHDYASYSLQVPQSHTDANRWIARFGDATWLPYQSTWYLGKNPADDSHVQTFTAGGYTFLNISLEWFHSNSSSTWLKSILAANPTKPTIISTHSYLVPWVGDLRRVSPEGDSVWSVIKAYPQVFLVLSGHVYDTTVDGSVATRTVANNAGSQVMETVCDFQNCSPGNGWVRLFNIDTVSTTGNIKVTTITTITGTPNTTDDFTGSLDFVSRFGPPNDGGDDTTPPGAPGALAGTTTPNSALLTWQAAVDPAPSSGIKGYDVDRGAAGSTVFVSGTSLDVTGLAAATSYTFRVQAIDTAGNRSEWSSVQVTTQAAGLSAFVMGINLNGNAVTIESNAWRSYATALGNGLTVSPSPLLAATALTPSPAADTDTHAMLNSAIYSAGNVSGFSAEASATTQAAAVVPAAALVEESFDYTAGLAINGCNGGTGWAGAWANNRTAYALTVTDPMAAVTGVNEIGGALQLLGDGNNTYQSTSRSFAPAIVDTAGMTYWLAFEIQSGIVLKGTQDFWLRSGSIDSYKLLTLNTTAGSFSSFGTNWTNTGVQLMLFKLVMNGAGINETLTLYVNPDLSAVASSWTAKATGSMAMDGGFDGFDLYSNTRSIATWAGPFHIDELRLATTWQGAVGQAASFTPVETWRHEKFGDERNEGIAADDQDPNHNGIINLLEYALGGDPLEGTTGTGILPQAERDSSDKLQIRFSRYPDRSDLMLTAQAADALDGPWEDLAVSTAGAAFAPAGAALASESGTRSVRSVLVTDSCSMSDPSHPKRFMRLKVEK